jgi:signal transduction histidine kinase
MLGAAIWVFIALACAVVVLRGLFVSHVEGQVRARLISDLTQLAATAEVDAEGTVTISQPLSEPQFRRPLSGLYWQIETLDGKGLLRSRSLWDGMLKVPHPSDETLAQAEEGIVTSVVVGPGDSPLLVVERQILFPNYDKPLRLMVGWDEGQLKGLIDAFTRTLAVSFAVLAVGIVAAAWAQIAFGLGPLRRLRLALSAVGRGKAKRLQGTYPSEVMPLVKDLNAMLGRNERMMTSARETAGNLAHGLKTPLAIIANEAQTLAGQGHSETATLLAQQVELMRRQIDHHLARARAQAAGETRGLKAPVDPSIQRLVRVMSRLHDGALHYPPPNAIAAAAAFQGDAQTLEEMLGNLLENACKWADSRVRVSLALSADSRILITVEDDGPGIPEDRLSEVLRRGRRLDESKPGSGLGLAIVDDLTSAVGGTLTLDRSPDFGGLRAVLALPMAP